MRNTLSRHQNPHGYCVSVLQYDHTGLHFLKGFTLSTFPTKAERDEYATDFKKMTGWPWDDMDDPR